MSAWEFGFLVLAGVGAGLTGSIAGLASLISYPALLAVGLPPVTANVTNTVALVLTGVGSVSASRPELKGQGRRLVPLATAGLFGGAAGLVAAGSLVGGHVGSTLGRRLPAPVLRTAIVLLGLVAIVVLLTR